ncbi:hypothetical protein O0I10_000600 [Lichtheimia ornata]|uniref:Uncharacterized protein n=1 Tax=Lichtheimia ornata TaxID=688661 RepID=A0AAD8DII0_9FUNG|nr:uncharacterized protein O0I10_000600 [Lichtheimia ornata]KAJ8663361.1 hypothetical protein O0I10_000600 [Lichtheimia ornata]
MSFSIAPGKTSKSKPLPPALYPIRGFLHLANHPRAIGGPILTSAIKASVLSILVIAPLVKYGFAPHSRLLSKLFQELKPEGKLNWLVGTGSAATASIFMLVEAFAVMGAANEHFVGSVKDRFFDAILQERDGLPPKKDKKKNDGGDEKESINIPSAQEVVNSLNVAVDEAKKSVNDAMDDAKKNMPQTLEEVQVKAHHFLSPVNIMALNAQNDNSWGMFFLRPTLFIVTLPLNLIPFVGPFTFVNIQALQKGGATHKRYFDLYNWSPKRRQKRIEQGFWQYQQFGLVATALEMIPFAGFVFSYTNHIGAAMWLMDLKESNTLESGKFFKIF